MFDKEKTLAKDESVNVLNLSSPETKFQDKNVIWSCDINVDLLSRGYFKDKTSRQLTKLNMNMYLKVKNVSGKSTMQKPLATTPL